MPRIERAHAVCIINVLSRFSFILAILMHHVEAASLNNSTRREVRVRRSPIDLLGYVNIHRKVLENF